mgnify:FL=1
MLDLLVIVLRLTSLIDQFAHFVVIEDLIDVAIAVVVLVQLLLESGGEVTVGIDMRNRSPFAMRALAPVFVRLVCNIIYNCASLPATRALMTTLILLDVSQTAVLSLGLLGRAGQIEQQVVVLRCLMLVGRLPLGLLRSLASCECAFSLEVLSTLSCWGDAR